MGWDGIGWGDGVCLNAGKVSGSGFGSRLFGGNNSRGPGGMEGGHGTLGMTTCDTPLLLFSFKVMVTIFIIRL